MMRIREMPLMEKAARPSARVGRGGQHVSVDAIAQDVAAAIIERRLPPGTWLREEALGKVYSVSRTKVRAALVMLTKDKLIENIPDKGCFVCQPSVEEAREVFGVRRILEAEVVRLLIERANPQDYERLAQHVQREREALHQTLPHALHTPTASPRPPAVPDSRSIAHSTREKLLGDFHVVLAETVGNGTLAELVREMVARSSLIAMLYHTTNDPQCSTQEHEEFLQLCRSGDVAAAVQCMDAHLRRIEANLQLESERTVDRPLNLVSALLA